MVACFAVCIMVSGCIKYDEQLRITFTDIPAEYNGKSAQASLCDEEGYVEGSGASIEITNGKTTIDFSRPGYYNGGLTIRDKGEYILVFHIKEEFFIYTNPNPAINFPGYPKGHVVWHWEGERKIKINKIHTSVSFNTLEMWDGLTYPYTEYFDFGE